MSRASKYIAVTSLIMAAATITIFITTRNSAVISLQLSLLSIFVLNLGIAAISLGLYITDSLQRRGLESSSKKQRKAIFKAYAMKRLPNSPELHIKAIKYAGIQAGLIRAYLMPVVFYIVGIALAFVGLNLLLRTDESGLSRYWGLFNSIYLFVPIIRYLREMSIIRSNAELLGTPEGTIEPPPDDIGWWTGRW
jgi:hypothetical protein